MLLKGATDSSDFLYRLRRGKWDVAEILEVAEHLDRKIVEKEAIGEPVRDPHWDAILAFLAVMFYSKDKFQYQRDSEEYRAVEMLYGRLLAALGL